MSQPDAPCGGRRAALCQLAALAVAGTLPVTALADVPPEKQPPQPGDLLATASDDDAPHDITPEEVKLNAAPVVCYPKDPASGVVRDGSRLNQILLVRLDPKTLDDATRARAADGLVAYAATCTHTGCSVSVWKEETRHFVCPCHSSEFDPARGATRVAGPAPRPLPALPLKLADKRIEIAAAFTAKVGINRA